MKTAVVMLVLLALAAPAQQPDRTTDEGRALLMQGDWLRAGPVMTKEPLPPKVVRIFRNGTWREKGIDMVAGKIIYDIGGIYHTKGVNLYVTVTRIEGTHPYKLNTVHRYGFDIDEQGRLKILKWTSRYGTIVEVHDRLPANAVELK